VKTAITVYALALTVGTYLLGRRLSRLWPSPLTTPLFFSAATTIAVLLLSRVSFADYAPAKEIVTTLLGPAVVALAVPLHKHRRLLLANALSAIAGLMAGALSTMVVAVVLARLFKLSRVIILSISVKSVTAPVAVEISRLLNADPTLTAAFVIVTGMIGAMVGPVLLDKAGISSPIARGLALGTISHGQGTARAAQESEISGAIAGIAVGLAAVFMSLVAPRVIGWL
jgi:putative effector of murein hydrolase